MRSTKILALFILSLSLFSCGNGKDLSKKFKLILNAENDALKTGETLQISLQPDKNAVLDSVIYRTGWRESLVEKPMFLHVKINVKPRKTWDAKNFHCYPFL